MGDALRGLTGRGRGLLAVGIGVCLVAVVFGQPDLLRVGTLVLALPLLSLALVARARYRLSCARSVVPRRAAVGEPVLATLALRNLSRLPTGLLLLEDGLPWQLGVHPRFVVERLESNGAREVTYAIATDHRGRYEVGPLAVRLVDPFGLCAVVRTFRATDSLLVAPAVHRLPPVAVTGDWAGEGDSRAHAVAGRGEDDVVPRDYRTGDDLRRVHWRATARVGTLMVRNEEQPWRSRATVLLDTRASAHRGSGPASSLEWALSTTASVAVHLQHRGWTVRVVDGDGTAITGTSGDGADVEGLLLDALAVLEPGASVGLGATLPGHRRALADGLVVAVLGAITPQEAADLQGVRPPGGAAVALIGDVGWWDAPGPRATAQAAATRTAAALLTRGGWRVAVLAPDTPVAAAWSAVGRGHPLTAPEPPGRGGAPGSVAGTGTAPGRRTVGALR